METGFQGWTLAELAASLDGTLNGPGEFRVRRLGLAHSDDPEAIAFAESDRFLAVAEKSQIGALLVGPGVKTSKPHIVVGKPRLAFLMLLRQVDRPLPLNDGIHPTAIVDPSAQIDPSARVGAYAVIERGVKLGAGARVYAHAYVGEDCVIGEQAAIHPGAVLYCSVTLGPRSVIHSGAVIGADGFSYVWDGTRQMKIPQTGGVRIEADVEIGALTAVDRAVAGETVIGEGTKLDNFVQVAHNVRIGKHSVVASQVGFSGSSVIGDRVTIAGQTGVNHDVSVADDVVLGGRTGVTGNITEAGAYWGLPARPIRDAQKSALLVAKLPELLQRIKDLEKRVKELENHDR